MASDVHPANIPKKQPPFIDELDSIVVSAFAIVILASMSDVQPLNIKLNASAFMFLALTANGKVTFINDVHPANMRWKALRSISSAVMFRCIVVSPVQPSNIE